MNDLKQEENLNSQFQPNKNKTILIIVLVVIVIALILGGVAYSLPKKQTTVTVTEPKIIYPSATPESSPVISSGWIKFANINGYSLSYPEGTIIGGNDFALTDETKGNDVYVGSLHIRALSQLYSSGSECGLEGTLNVKQHAEKVWNLNIEDKKRPEMAGKEVSEISQITVGNWPAFQFAVTKSIADGCGGYLVDKEFRFVFVENEGKFFEISYPVNDTVSEQILKTFTFDNLAKN